MRDRMTLHKDQGPGPARIGGSGPALRPRRRLCAVLVAGPVLAGPVLAGPVLAGLTACSPVGLAVGAGAKVVTMVQEERGFGGVVDDAAIQVALNNALLAAGDSLFRAVDVTVRDGAVLLMGAVPTPKDRLAAVRLAWEVEGVRAVYNELTLTDSSDLVDYARDVWLANTLETFLLFDSEVQSINYTVDVVNGTLYLMGIARDEDERARVVAHARGMPHLRRIVDYTRLIAERSGRPATSPAPAPAPAPAN